MVSKPTRQVEAVAGSRAGKDQDGGARAAHRVRSRNAVLSLRSARVSAVTRRFRARHRAVSGPPLQSPGRGDGFPWRTADLRRFHARRQRLRCRLPPLAVFFWPVWDNFAPYNNPLWRPLLPYGYSYKAFCVLDQVKPSFVIFDILALWRIALSARVPTLRTDYASECPGVKNYKWRPNPVWHIAVPIWQQWVPKGWRQWRLFV